MAYMLRKSLSFVVPPGKTCQRKVSPISFTRIRWCWTWVSLLLASGFPLNRSLSAVYPGNGDGSHGGEIGKGSLELKDNGTYVTATLTRGTAPLDGDLVLFIDSVPGGFSSTSPFSDKSSELPRAISGVDSSGAMRTTANFAPGFTADYAIAVGVNAGGGIYHLVQTDVGAVLERVGAVTLSPPGSQSYATYTFTFDWTLIGLPRTRTNFFMFESIYASTGGRRSTESFESVTGSGDWGGTLNFSNFDVYGVNPVPEATNAALVIFSGIVVFAGSAGWVLKLLKARNAT